MAEPEPIGGNAVHGGDLLDHARSSIDRPQREQEVLSDAASSLVQSMRSSAFTLTLLFSLFQQLLCGQYGIGVQGGPFHTTPAWEAKQALGNAQGWTAGLQFVEGRRGGPGFRTGLDVGQRAFDVLAKSNEGSIIEEFSAVSTMLWLSFEMRWSLSRRHRIFFELGPVIGMEIHERRSGSRYYEGQDFYGRPWRTNEVATTERESGFAIRDGRWRLGFSSEWPLAGRWLVTAGAHVSPGVGNWALGHGYATLDSSIRMGLLYLLPRKGRR